MGARHNLTCLLDAKDPVVEMPCDCWKLSRIPLYSRTELAQATRKWDSVVMQTVELWQRWFLLRWRTVCSSPLDVFGRGLHLVGGGHMDKTVLNTRANVHTYEINLAGHFHGGRNHQHTGHATLKFCGWADWGSRVVASMMYPS